MRTKVQKIKVSSKIEICNFYILTTSSTTKEIELFFFVDKSKDLNFHMHVSIINIMGIIDRVLSNHMWAAVHSFSNKRGKKNKSEKEEDK